MKLIWRRVLQLTVVLLLLLPLVAMSATASDELTYEVKQHYPKEFSEQYFQQTLTKDGKPTLTVKVDLSQAGLVLSDSPFKEYRPQGQEHPEFTGFVNLVDKLPSGAGWKRGSMWGYDMYYEFRYNKALHEIWELRGYVHIPELELANGPFFTIQFDLSNRYRHRSAELPFEDYYSEQSQRHIESDLLGTLSKISISYETSAVLPSQPGGAGHTVTSEAGSESGDDASASASIPTLVAVALTATVAAAAGVASASASVGAAISPATTTQGYGETGAEEEKPKSTLRMIISKNFGRQIRYGDQPVHVSARIVELFEKGGQQERQDLTAKLLLHRLALTSDQPR